MSDQLPPSDLETTSVAGEATNASSEMVKAEETLATGEVAKAESAAKKTPTEEQKAAYKRRLDELKQFGQEIGYEEELPSKKQRKCPKLPVEAAAFWNSVSDGLDTQISEIKKYRLTEFIPYRDELREKEWELRELEREVKGMRKVKERMQEKLKEMQDDIDNSRALLYRIEEHDI